MEASNNNLYTYVTGNYKEDVKLAKACSIEEQNHYNSYEPNTNSFENDIALAILRSLSNEQEYGEPKEHQIKPEKKKSPTKEKIARVENSSLPRREKLSSEEYMNSLTSDFVHRDQIQQSLTSKSNYFSHSDKKWGPPAKVFPEPTIPNGVDPIQWKRDRIIEVAKHYTGLPYCRHDGKRGHFPDRGCGLDCSNFVSWVYNYGLGIKFSSNVNHLINGGTENTRLAGRKLRAGEELKKGDLIFLNSRPNHVVIYIDAKHYIDSTSGRPEGVQVREFRKNRWCSPSPDNERFLCARRPIV